MLPFLIGRHVPPDDEHWKNYVLLVHITSFLLCPAVTREDCFYLKVLFYIHALYKCLQYTFINPHHVGGELQYFARCVTVCIFKLH